MREILFRGKTKVGKWVCGNYAFTDNNGEQHFIFQNKAFEYEVIPETVGQYTGLTDKNGKKIFEGDILKGYVYPFFNEEKDEFNYFAEVVWFENSPAFGYVTHKNPLSKVNGISNGNTDYLEDFYSNCWEIIGNIHDNPELLKGGADNG